MSNYERQLAFMRNGGGVRRFHCYRTVLTDLVGHHTYNLMSLLIIAVPPEFLTKGLLLAAHQHDQPEFKTGDIPAPTKRGVPGLRDACAAAEGAAIAEACLPDYGASLTHDEHNMLKLADSLDGMFFCIEERRAGSRVLDNVFETYRGYVSTLLTTPNTHVFGFREIFDIACEQWSRRND